MMKDEWRECLNQKQFDHWRTWYATSFIQVTLNGEILDSRRREPRYFNPSADGNEEQDGSVKDAS